MSDSCMAPAANVVVPDQAPLLVYGRRDRDLVEGHQVWLRQHGQNLAVWPA